MANGEGLSLALLLQQQNDLLSDVKDEISALRTDMAAQAAPRGAGGGGQGGGAGKPATRGTSTGASDLAGAVKGKGGGAALAGLAVASVIASAVSSAIRPIIQAQTKVFEQAGGLETQEAVQARAGFRQQVEGGQAALRAGQATLGKIPLIGGLITDKLQQTIAQREFRVRQAVEPGLRTIRGAKQQTIQQFAEQTRATGQSIDEASLRRVFDFNRQREAGVTDLVKAVEKIAGENEAQLYKKPQVQAAANVYGG